MQIDWFTVIAQVINFLILVFLLKRFLYVPIISAMDQRAEKLAQQAVEAENKIKLAENQRNEYLNKIANIENEKNVILAESLAMADTQKKEKLDQIRLEMDELKQTWLRDIQNDQQELLHGIHTLLTEQVISLTRRILIDLADSDLESKICNKFIDNLKNHDKSELDQFSTACRADNDTITLFTAFDIPAETQQDLLTQLRLLFYPQLKLEFLIKPELVCGLAVVAQKRKITWNMEEALKSFDDSIQAVLDSPNNRS